ncbi:MAG: Holliday junction branch migration protein RuvA [Gammaproteobacteria bacterium]|jgi:holliday junction DNA helicase RuvA
MIGRLEGVVWATHPPVILLGVHGVGYEVNAPLTAFFQLPSAPKLLTVHTHLVVREDAQQLYGFLSSSDRDWFRELIKVSGVGPRMALAILSGMSGQMLAETVVQQHVALLQNIPGIGKKTAERLVLDLQDKCQKWLEASCAPSTNNMETSCVNDAVNAQSFAPEQDAQYALIALGYKPAEAAKVIRKVRAPGASSEDLIKLALREMVRV